MDALWRTAYGLVFLAKLALLLPLFALAVINRFRLTEPAEAGDAKAAIPLHLEVLTVRKQTLGPDHPNTLRAAADLAQAYRHAGRARDALPLAEQAAHLGRDLDLVRSDAHADGVHACD